MFWSILLIENRLAPIERFAAIPSGPILFSDVLYRIFQEVRRSRLEIRVLNDGRCNKDKQVRFLALLRIAAEQVSQEGHISEARHFGAAFANVVLDHSTEHE